MISRLHESLAARLAARKDGDDGFTLVELLVVVLIIGILAAIAIPIFIGQQNSAKDSAANSDASNAGLAEAAYYTANNSVYSSVKADLKNYGLSETVANSVTVTVDSTNKKFCVQVNSAAGTSTSIRSYAVSDTQSVAKGTCTAGVFTATTWS